MRRFRARMHFHFIWLLAVVGAWTMAVVALARATPGALLFTMVFLLMMGLAARRLVRRMARPVEVLTEASRRFGAGELDYRVPLPSWRRRRRRLPIDELVALGAAWNEMAERIEKLVAGQRELLANVSHELRSPLARLRVALELLPRDDRVAGAITDIEELDRLIDDVLTASRLDGATLPARLEEVALGPVFAGLVSRAGQHPDTAGKQVRASGAAVVVADPALLKRALWNLIENAARYGAPPIELAVEQRDGEVVISVTDEGPGVPEADHARVLEPFARGRNEPTGRGVGLGLTIARRVAEVHGGRIVLESRNPKGFRVSIVIPVSLE